MLYTQLVGHLLLYAQPHMQRMVNINALLKSPHCVSGPLKTARLAFTVPIPEIYIIPKIHM